MSFKFQNLDSRTREVMLDEFNFDVDKNKVYFSTRFNKNGYDLYPQLMRNVIKEGNEVTLANELRNNNCFKQLEETTRGNRKVPVTAAETFAEGEFNRYFIRAICLRAIEEDLGLEVYRAKEVSSPRYESIQMIGKKVDSTKLLDDLRLNIGVDTALGLPNGPNSGLSVKLVNG